MKNDSNQVKQSHTKPIQPDIRTRDLLQHAKDKIEEIRKAVKNLPTPSVQPN